MTTATDAPWLNLGCGKFPLEGYINVDQVEKAHADICADVWELSWSGLGAVRMDHFLEHFSWRETKPLLELVKGWLMAGGIVDIEVPDLEAIMSRGVTGDWLRYLYGSQQHSGEYHKTGFTIASLFDVLSDAGYYGIKVTKFVSKFETRAGMPCLHATARA